VSDLINRLRCHEQHAVHDYDDDCEEAANEIERLNAEWRIQNDCIADQHDKIRELSAERSELIAALEYIVEALEFRIAVGPQGARERAERVLASVSGRE
jgi:hypothetical protein